MTGLSDAGTIVVTGTRSPKLEKLLISDMAAVLRVLDIDVNTNSFGTHVWVVMALFYKVV